MVLLQYRLVALIPILLLLSPYSDLSLHRRLYSIHKKTNKKKQSYYNCISKIPDFLRLRLLLDGIHRVDY